MKEKYDLITKRIVMISAITMLLISVLTCVKVMILRDKNRIEQDDNCFIQPIISFNDANIESLCYNLHDEG